ncbi:hypothetical protein [Natronorubrum tibetense]|uniref:Uncharacterized protein n=1 Tax=Natronorubrum tibetense GA33 TaxID=1114856 RepID=L9VH12_9EURY|nr:hypothetical protein [Natronorubrum tibetense]ELY36257.1 hypothetical protein C496_21924 [Natronorubrum tibetense GA33]
MSPRDAVDPVETDDRQPEPADRRFRLASGVYGGVLLAGIASVLAPAVGISSLGPVATYPFGFAGGFVGGAALARADRHLPARLGQTLGRRLAVVAPALVFGLLWLVTLEGIAGDVALVSAILVFAAGYVLSQLAGNRYVDSVTPGDPEETWRWDPPGSLRLDAALFVFYVALGAGNAAGGNWEQALLWLSLGIVWIGTCLAEGRWAFGPGRDRCEIQVYETGLVKRRPYTKSFVAWHDINHTRLRGDELVLDYGLRDVRFDRDELEDSEAVLKAVDRRLSEVGSRY